MDMSFLDVEQLCSPYAFIIFTMFLIRFMICGRLNYSHQSCLPPNPQETVNMLNYMAKETFQM